MTDPFQQGYLAAAAEVRLCKVHELTRNPYPPASCAASVWYEGWNEFRRDLGARKTPPIWRL